MSPLRFTWRLIRARPWLAALNVALAITIAGLDLLPGPVTQRLFDRLGGETTAGPGPEILIGGLLALALARTVIKTNAVLVSELHHFIVGAILRRNLLARLLARPRADAAGEATGATLSRFRDDATGVATFLALLSYGTAIALLALGASFLLVRIDAGLAAGVFLPLIATVGLTQRAYGRLARYREAAQAATARVTGALGEMFEAVGAVQVAGAERHLIAQLRRLNDERRRLILRDSVLTAALGATSASSVSLGTGLVLLLAAGTMRGGGFTVGDFALFVYYMPFVGEFTRVVGRVLAVYRGAGISFARLVAALGHAEPSALVAPAPLGLHRPLPPPPQPARTPADRLESLALAGLSYTHPTTGRGIGDISLKIARGESVVVTGRIGAGKTTLLRALLGQLPADAGEVRWNGQTVADPATFCVPPRVAYTPQVPRLFSETLRENILLGLPEGDADLPGALRVAALDRDLARFPDGLATPVGPRGVRLSGGQVQRAAAARMLVRRAELLVVDDLSSALDVETERWLWSRLRARPATTILAVSHRRAALARADRIVVLKDGRVVGTGSLPDLLEHCEELRHLWADGDL